MFAENAFQINLVTLYQRKVCFLNAGIIDLDISLEPFIRAEQVAITCRIYKGPLSSKARWTFDFEDPRQNLRTMHRLFRQRISEYCCSGGGQEWAADMERIKTLIVQIGLHPCREIIAEAFESGTALPKLFCEDPRCDCPPEV